MSALASTLTDAAAEHGLPALPRVTLPHTIRHLCEVDVAPLQALVARASEAVWSKEDSVKENRFPCFHHTQHIIFRFIRANADARVYVSHPAWTIWSPVLLPIMQQAIAPYGFARPVFPKAMLARLAAGNRVDLHRDGAGSNLETHKIHVPVQTNPEAYFDVGGESFHLALGHAYEVNNVRHHGAHNDGDADRIHFIFEVYDEAAADAA